MKNNINVRRFRLGSLPSRLEELADKHDMAHEEVGLDALYAWSHYRVEHGFDEQKSYDLVMKHLEKKYEVY